MPLVSNLDESMPAPLGRATLPRSVGQPDDMDDVVVFQPPNDARWIMGIAVGAEFRPMWSLRWMRGTFQGG